MSEIASNGSSGSTNGATASSGYRVSWTGGGLEVSARLTTSEELELLVRVLEANKVLGLTRLGATPRPSLKASRKSNSSTRHFCIAPEATY
jgi:hypothetical protein